MSPIRTAVPEDRDARSDERLRIPDQDQCPENQPSPEATGNLPDSQLASLLARVSQARVLHEHHVWEAVRLLPDAAGLPADTRQSPQLRAMMDGNAFCDALRLIAQACHPARQFRMKALAGGLWDCSVNLQSTEGPPCRPLFRASHRDPAAAILAALLSSSLQMHRRARQASGALADADRGTSHE